jgi:hypothetical protein
MVMRPSSAAAVMILQMSSGSIRNVCSLSSVTHPGVVPIFASTVRPIAAADGTVMVRYSSYDFFRFRTCSPFIMIPIC